MENRLVAASGAKGANLRYDPLGRLYEVNGPFGLTRFVYDGDHVAAEYNSAGTVLRRYMWGPGADEPILWDEGSAVNCSGGKFLHPDRQGSVVAAADCAGALIGINKYDEYGIPQSGNIGRFQYTGQAWLPELGMYYYKARIYSPTLGRFMQTDPIGYKDQFNLYAYVGNDPVNKSDPDGKESVQLSLRGLEAIEADQLEHPGDPAARKAVVLATGAAVSCVFGCRLVPAAVRAIKDAISGKASNPSGSAASNGGRAKNKLGPDSSASGEHSTFKRGPDGKISNHAEYKPNPNNPSGHQEVKRVDVTGRAHTNPDGTRVSTPHVKEAGVRGVRPARPDEIP